jgi:hypothetical protein
VRGPLRRAASPADTRSTSKGKKTQEGQDVRQPRKGSSGAPDPPAEQGLEAELCGVRTLPPATSVAEGSKWRSAFAKARVAPEPRTSVGVLGVVAVAASPGSGNGKGATVSRRRGIACRRGEFFGGS